MQLLEGQRNSNEEKYLDMLREVYHQPGPLKENRTGVRTREKFGLHTVYNYQQGFPLLTTKKMFWKGIVAELIWFLRGDTNIKFLNDNGVHIWDEWADEYGNLGPVYGHQWRNWEQRDGDIVDQIFNVIRSIRTNPNSRRHIVSAWNVAEIHEMALPPCHMMFQFNVDGHHLDLAFYQRSADMFLGVPFNIASYALLLKIIATYTGYVPGKIVHTIGNAHIYENHFDQVEEQLSRTPTYWPLVEFSPKSSNIGDIRISDIELIGYRSQSAIKAPIAV